MKLSLVVPLLNEKESLPLLMKAVADSLDTGPAALAYEVIFVDDGSTDGSFDVIRGLSGQYPGKIRAIRVSRNYGKAAALAVGIEKSDGDIIITMDADLQDDPAVIPDMVKLLDSGYDVVSGWKKKRYDPITKTLPSKVWNLATSLVAGVRLHDFNCGFKAYRAEAAKGLEIYGERHRYLPVLAHWNGYRVTEMVVPHHPRKFGKSKYGFGRGLKGIFDLLTLLFLRKYMKNPLHFFGLLGLVFASLGTVVLAYFGVEWIVTRQMHIRPLVLLSMGAIIMGIQFISIGLIGEMITHASPRNTYTIKDSL
jgi:glycosyltransferase involved in cell wall biosynthesis